MAEASADASSGPRLSKRARATIDTVHPIYAKMAAVFPNFQSADNPDGLVNMGIAESSLGHPDLVERFNSSLRLTEKDLTCVCWRTPSC